MENHVKESFYEGEKETTLLPSKDSSGNDTFVPLPFKWMEFLQNVNIEKVIYKPLENDKHKLISEKIVQNDKVVQKKRELHLEKKDGKYIPIRSILYDHGRAKEFDFNDYKEFSNGVLIPTHIVKKLYQENPEEPLRFMPYEVTYTLY